MYSQEHSLHTQLFLTAEHLDVASGREVLVSVISIPWELTRNAELASPGWARGEGGGGVSIAYSERMFGRK